MQTYLYPGKSGKTRIVAIDLVYISPWQVARVLSTVESVDSVRVRPPFHPSPDIRVWFQFHHQPYIVFEPFGDNSQYMVAPESRDAEDLDMSPIVEAFVQYRPSFVRRMVGDVITAVFE